MFIHLSVDGHLGYFHLFTTVNSAAMNISVQVFALRPVFNYGLDLGVEFLTQMVILCLTFPRTTKLFSTVIAPSYNPTSNVYVF